MPSTTTDRQDHADSLRACIEIGDTRIDPYRTSVSPDVVWSALGDAITGATGMDLYEAAETVAAMLYEARRLTRGLR
jgi:hypothetical protein